MYSLKAKKEKRKKKEGKKGNIVKKDMSHQDYLDCLSEKRKFMHTIRLCDHLKINSTPSNRIKSPLALTMINNTWWMMGLALCHRVLLVCSKYLENRSIIYSETFVVYFTF